MTPNRRAARWLLLASLALYLAALPLPLGLGGRDGSVWGLLDHCVRELRRSDILDRGLTGDDAPNAAVCAGHAAHWLAFAAAAAGRCRTALALLAAAALGPAILGGLFTLAALRGQPGAGLPGVGLLAWSASVATLAAAAWRGRRPLRESAVEAGWDAARDR